MSYTIHQVLRTCLSFGMSEQERDAFEVLLRFPHITPELSQHPKFTCNLYIKLRDIGLDDDQVSEVLGAMQ
jgi:hypothetical protein